MRNPEPILLTDRFRGTLAGLLIGDSLGAPVESLAHSKIDLKFIDRAVNLAYTDDTQLMIGLAESLIEIKEVSPEHIFHSFWQNYHADPAPGYSRGFGMLLSESKSGIEVMKRIRNHSPNNGAAMRAAPLALCYYHDFDLLKKKIVEASAITHNSPNGLAGALMVVFIIARNLREERDKDHEKLFIDTANFLKDISPEFADKLEIISSNLDTPCKTILEKIGCRNPEIGPSMKAIESMPMALFHYAYNVGNYRQTIFDAIKGGGDTDTVAAVAGAMAGSLIGFAGIDKDLLQKLKPSKKGLQYVLFLADKLYEIWTERGFR